MNMTEITEYYLYEDKILNICLIIFISCALVYLFFAYKHLNIANKIHADYSGYQVSDYKPLIWRII